MVDKIFSGDTIKILQKALDAATVRQQVIADNIANVNTPGFKRSDVVFQHELKAALMKTDDLLPLSTTHAMHIPFPRHPNIDEVQPRIIMQNDTVSRNDLNNVDIDQEMAKLAENQVLFSALSQITSMKLSSLRTVIKEGR